MMTNREMRNRAQAAGVTVQTNNKVDLIRAIQAAEGNLQCFQTGRTQCNEVRCCWMADCIPQQVAGSIRR